MATQHLFAAALVLVGLGWCRVAAAQPVPAAAGERCEAAVAETVKRMRGKQAQEIQFVGAKRVLAPTKGGDDIDVKGEHNGFDAMAELASWDQATFAVDTPSGGRHLYYDTKGNIVRTFRGFKPGVDIKGQGRLRPRARIGARRYRRLRNPR